MFIILHPALVRLLPGAAEALNVSAGLGLLRTSDQSVGHRSRDTLRERLNQIHVEMNRQLAASARPSTRSITARTPRPATIGPSWSTPTVSRDPACCSAQPPI